MSSLRRIVIAAMLLLPALPAVTATSVAASVATEVPDRAWMGPDGVPLPFDSAAELTDFLASAAVVASKDLSTGTTRPKKLTLERDGVRLHAVFHSIDRSERQVKRLANGQFVLHLRDSYRSQVAAYEISRLLGIDSVPPTVVRASTGRKGSVQLWIEHAMTEQKRRDQALDPPDLTVWNQQKAEQWVFDNLINNIDRNTGNTLIDGGWNLWLIDHTRSFGQDRELPYPERVTSLSKEMWSGLKALDPEEVRERLSPYLNKAEVRALLERREKLLELIEARIARLGEGRIVWEYGRPWVTMSVAPAS